MPAAAAAAPPPRCAKVCLDSEKTFLPLGPELQNFVAEVGRWAGLRAETVRANSMLNPTLCASPEVRLGSPIYLNSGAQHPTCRVVQFLCKLDTTGEELSRAAYDSLATETVIRVQLMINDDDGGASPQAKRARISTGLGVRSMISPRLFDIDENYRSLD